MNDQRPNPDELLARVQAEETRRARGKLKIFFGAAAGVGKTYAMLEAARERRAEGVDVVVGYVETHGRVETEALLGTATLRGMLQVIPRRTVAYRGAVLQEFDLDAALARRPALILVDELAHTNAPGSRHPKRWQDVEELRDAGIAVYTTINVQHVESLNDVVAQITGVQVRETVPDRVIEQADEIELVDLTPEELLQRLKEGKVYVPQQAERAIRSFFRRGNLIALRELALRRTADRVDEQMQRYKRDHAIGQTWPANERLLVCISHSPLSERLVRATRRMAAAMRAPWLVIFVETPRSLRLGEAERDRVAQTLRLAEQLGAETATLSGQRVSEEILTYALARNVTKIVVGKPERPRWQDLLFGSVVDDLVRGSGAIDVYVITGEQGESRPAAARALERTSGWPAYGWGVLVVALCTVLAWLLRSSFTEANLVMAYLLGVVVAAARFGRGPSILASVLSVAAFDFFFVQPYLTFAVSDVQYLVTFGVMLAVALVISTLTVRLRQQADAARQRERRVAALYDMSRDLAGSRGLEKLLRAVVSNIGQTFGSQVVIMLQTDAGRLQAWGSVAGWWAEGVNKQMIFAPDTHDQGVAQWVYDHGQMAGLGTDTLSGARALYLPLIGSRGAVGVLGARPAQPRRFLAPEQLHLLETFASQAALALERAFLADQAQRAQVQAEAERLRSSLLSSVSHDLRTPLTAITGAASTLLDGQAAIGDGVRTELVQGIYDEAARLNRLVGNLLDMTRLESGAVQVRKEWQPLEEVVGAALNRQEHALRERPLEVQLPPDLPLAPLDGALIEQVLVNLLDNAAKYTPPGSPILLSARAAPQELTVTIADRGPGIPSGDERRIFEKFYRAAPAGTHGSGLGLAICAAIVQAHGGRIWAESRPGGGAIFSFTLPVDGPPPAIAAAMLETEERSAPHDRD
ncbi:MAG: sensor histidine kinase KdpD [Kouleothrix sp.]|nr:sensor histidine kinase KdpD [Kouleothrix sp.]